MTPPDTTRLSFREWRATDLDAFHAICSDPAVMQFVGAGLPWSRQATRDFMSRASAASRELGYCQWPLIHKADLQLIGYCGLVRAEEAAEIGWRLARAHWGAGLATEAGRCVLMHGLTTLGLPRIVATVQAANAASRRVVEKLGMRPESRIERQGREIIVYARSFEDIAQPQDHRPRTLP